MTPLVRIGRNTAGAAIAASVLIGGGTTALADGQTNADAAPSTTPSTAPVSIEAADATAAKGYGDTSTAEIKVKAPVQRTETEAADSRDDDGAQGDADAQDRADGQRQDRADRDQQRTDRQSRTDRRDRTDRSERRDRTDRSERRASQHRSHRGSDAQASTKKQRSESSRGSAKGSSVVATARNGIGTPYVWGGETRAGWDCSGFTSWVYRQHGIELPHSARAQKAMGRTISRSEARPGDLVYTPGHVGIYAGNGKLIDAGRSGRNTTERKLWSGASWTFVRIG